MAQKWCIHHGMYEETSAPGCPSCRFTTAPFGQPQPVVPPNDWDELVVAQGLVEAIGPGLPEPHRPRLTQAIADSLIAFRHKGQAEGVERAMEMMKKATGGV